MTVGGEAPTTYFKSDIGEIMGKKKIHSWYLRDRIGLLKLKASEKATLSALVSHYPKAYASEVRLADLSGFSRRTVQRAIYSLIGKGYVQRTRRAGVTNLYQINADLILMHAADEEKKLPAKRAKAKAEHGERLRQVKRSCAPEEGPTQPRHGDAGSVVNPRHGGAGDPRHADALNIPEGMFIVNPDKEASSRVDSDESTPACKDEDNDTIIELGEEPTPPPPLPAFPPPSPAKPNPVLSSDAFKTAENQPSAVAPGMPEYRSLPSAKSEPHKPHLEWRKLKGEVLDVYVPIKFNPAVRVATLRKFGKFQKGRWQVSILSGEMHHKVNIVEGTPKELEDFVMRCYKPDSEERHGS